MDANYKPFWYWPLRPWRWGPLGWGLAAATVLLGYLVGLVVSVNAFTSVGKAPIDSPLFRVVYAPVIAAGRLLLDRGFH